MNRLDEEILKVLNEDMSHDEEVKYFSEKADELFNAYKDQGFKHIFEHNWLTFTFEPYNSNDDSIAVYFYDDDPNFIRLVLVTKYKKDMRFYPTSFDDALKIKDVREFLRTNGLTAAQNKKTYKK